MSIVYKTDWATGVEPLYRPQTPGVQYTQQFRFWASQKSGHYTINDGDIIEMGGLPAGCVLTGCTLVVGHDVMTTGNPEINVSYLTGQMGGDVDHYREPRTLYSSITGAKISNASGLYISHLNPIIFENADNDQFADPENFSEHPRTFPYALGIGLLIKNGSISSSGVGDIALLMIQISYILI
ncbi:TPA: hypothetical protein PFE07_004635 [Kluyvera cryocrescens]|nr:hypothetical protein [Kluyvera cryocrescens]